MYEPRLRPIVQAAAKRGLLHFTDRPESALADREIIFVAVGTPTGPLGDADLTYVRQAARDIAHHARGDVVVVNKSTVPVETADLVARLLGRECANANARFAVASNPEFLREGSAVEDFLRPDRIVIGTDDDRAVELLRDLYAPLKAPVLVVDPRTAEMIKYAANAFLATKVSFVNELANICEAVGARIDDVLSGIALDPRIGAHYMQPGLGFGGSCLPKDVSALAHVARAHAIEPAILDAALDVNRRQIVSQLQSIARRLGDLDGRRCAVLGLAFKPQTDDIRESPALVLVQGLLSQGAVVSVHDPVALPRARSVLGDRVRYADDAYEAARYAECAIVATPWNQYLELDWERIARSMQTPRVFDARNALAADRLQACGLEYHGIARALSKRNVEA